jgi:16S rRNA processing protein RimM
MEQYFNIGKLVATFGIQGQLILQHALGKKTALTGLKVVMIEMKKDDLLPYFITETKLKNDTEIYISLEEIDTKEKAKLLVPKQVWLLQKDFEKHVAADTTLSLLGFTIYDNDKQLSEIVEIIEQPHQILAKIIYQEKEMLIPVNVAFMVKMDVKNKIVVLDLPEGLLDIF